MPRRIQPQEIGRIIELQLEYHRLQAQSAQEQDANPKRRQHLAIRIKDAAAGKPLTSVSYLLQQMHQKMTEQDPASRELTHEYYEEVGGINGVMAHQAELALKDGLKDIDTEQHDTLIHAFFEAFIGIDEDKQPVARALPNRHIAHYPKGLKALIQSFMDKGLIIDCGRGNTPKIKLAHDTLLSTKTDQPHWQRLLEWFEGKQDCLSWRKEIEPGFLKWLEATQASDQQLKPEQYLIRDRKRLTPPKTEGEEYLIEDQQLQVYLKRSKAQTIKRKVVPALLVVFIMVCSGLFYWDQNLRITSKYAAHLGEKYGVPFGVTFLTEEQRSHKERHYRLDYQGGKLIELSYRNSRGYLKNDDTRENSARWAYEYKANGDLLTVNSYAFNGKPVGTQTYDITGAKNQALVSYYFRGDRRSTGTYMYLDSREDPIENNETFSTSIISKVKVNFNSDGYAKNRLFLNSAGYKAGDNVGKFGERYKYNDYGLLIYKEFLDDEGQGFPVKGVVKEVYERDFLGNIYKVSFIDAEDELTVSNYGYSIVKMKYDSWGNKIYESYYNEGGDSAVSKNGFHSISNTYNIFGDAESIYYMSDEMKLVKTSKGFSLIKIEYSNKGEELVVSFFGVDKNPIVMPDGYHCVKYKYDYLGNEISKSHYDLNKRPTIVKDGYFLVDSKYDEEGNRTSVSFLGADGNSVISKSGYALAKREYSDSGYVLSMSYYGVNEEPIFFGEGYHSVRWEYDEFGREKKERYYGVNGKPILNKLGYHSKIYEYPGLNSYVVSYLDLREIKVLNVLGFHSVKFELNALGNEIYRSYYGINKNPVINHFGVSVMRFDYDDYGNKISKSFYGVDGEKTIHQEVRVSSLKLDYDVFGNVTKQSYYGLNDELVMHEDELFSIVKFYYDRYGRLVKSSTFDVENKPVISKRGFYSSESLYDKTGNMVSEHYYGIYGEDVLNYKGYSSVKWKYDEQNRIVSESFFDVEEKPFILNDVGYHKIVLSYDVRGNIYSKSYYDQDGNAILNDGYHMEKLIYDFYNRLIYQYYYGLDYNPITNNDGFFVGRREYDKKGVLTGMARYDSNGNYLGGKGTLENNSRL